MKPSVDYPTRGSSETQDDYTRRVALEYALVEIGQGIIPLHTMTLKGCSCGRPDCTDPGKHPKTRRGLKDATFIRGNIDRWFTRAANIGIRTGGGLYVLDVDEDKGGFDSLSGLEDEFGALPPTLTCLTGGGGLHYYFWTGKGLRSRTGIRPGIDVRCEGGYVVAPPSIHVSQRSYEWDATKPSNTAELPRWLEKLSSAGREMISNSSTPGAVIEGGRNDYLTRVAGAMRRQGASSKAILSALKSENEARNKPPLPMQEVRKIAKSVSQYAPMTDPGDWSSNLKTDQRGLAKSTVGNASIYLMFRNEWSKVLAYDEFTDEVIFQKEPPDGILRPKKGDKLRDENLVYLQHWLAKKCGPVFTTSQAYEAARAVAMQNRINSLTEHLNSLSWDGKPRLDTWLPTYLGAKNKDIVNKMGTWWLISAVARAFEPGCQVDHMLVLEGLLQGEGKSQVARILGGPFYLGTLPRLDHQYAALVMQGYWIIEAAELSSMKGVTLNKIKNFLTQVEDVYKRPYDRLATRRKRMCVFLGTTNEAEYLDDAENRRFWPVRIGKLKKDDFERDRDQLLAETVARYKQGEKWYPEYRMTELLEEQSERAASDVWEPRVINVLLAGGGKPITTEGMLLAIGFEPYRMDRKVQVRVSKVLRKLGWTKVRELDDGGRRIRRWKPTPRWKEFLDLKTR